jgi:formamidopyrimidine-DNA glycosylase
VNVVRRAKYLLVVLSSGTIVIHLGMTGVLRVVPADAAEQKHDHVDVIFTDSTCLRFTDSRRFGIFLFLKEDPWQHKLLEHLGPEPLSDDFDGAYLYQKAQGKRIAVKAFLMDQSVVVGVGNIYANEALFHSGILPSRAAGQISLQRYSRLVAAIKDVLVKSIAAGGTTVSDFRQSDGKPGYFKQQLDVYGRGGEPCVKCGEVLSVQRIGQRSTFYCQYCQN